jgi:hypothetical protein
MRNLLLTCCMFTIALSQATAQVSMIDFEANIKSLDSTIMIWKDVTRQNNAFDALNVMMNKQITYFNSRLAAPQQQYVADTAKASFYQRKAAYEYKTAASETKTDEAHAQRDKQAGDTDSGIANQANMDAFTQLDVIHKINESLATEKSMYKDLQRMRGDLVANQSSIDNDLNSFEQTLKMIVR